MKRWSFAVLATALSFGAGWFYVGNQLTAQDRGPQRVTTAHATYRDVVKKVLPAVVSIETRTKVAVRGDRRQPNVPFNDQQLPEEFRRFFEDFRRQPMEA